MNSQRIKEIQKETAYPDSISVQQALLKVWNECEQEKVVNENDLLPDVSIALSGFMDWLWINHNILTNADNNKIALEKYLATL